MDWSYYCSCYGKGECDGEGGIFKNVADKYAFRGDASGKRVAAKVQDPEEFVDWCRHGHGAGGCLATPKRDLVAKLRSGLGGIFRRFFHIVPVKAQWLSTVASQLWRLSPSLAGFTPSSTSIILLWLQAGCRTARVPPEHLGRPQRRSGTEDGAYAERTLS
eukprot:6195695-Pleurochrysis_carterae.AAC.5